MRLCGRIATVCDATILVRLWSGRESNPRHTDFQSVALPTELPDHHNAKKRAQKYALQDQMQTLIAVTLGEDLLCGETTDALLGHVCR